MAPDLNQDAIALRSRNVRLFVYQHFVDRGRPPSIAEAAQAFQAGHDAVRAVYESLAQSHVLVLDPETREIAMAMPFSAAPTAYRVQAGASSYWAN